ncbi:MAG: hypothetical protein ACR2RF_32375 [Geminicoccaceae bacterium]
MNTLETALPWITLGLIIGLPLTLRGYKPLPWAIYGVALYVASYFISNSWNLAYVLAIESDAHGLALRWKTLTALVLIVIYLTVVYRLLTLKRLPELDSQVKLVWLILLIAEGYSVLEYVGCKFLDDPFGDRDLQLRHEWGKQVSTYACGRVLGTFGPYVAPITTTAFLIVLNIRSGRAWIAAQNLRRRWQNLRS